MSDSIIARGRFSAIPETRFTENGDLPSVAAFRRVAASYNFVSGYARKQIFSKAYATQSTPAGVLAATRNVYFCFRTGENVRSVVLAMSLVPADTAGAAAATAQFELDDGTNNLLSFTQATGTVDTSGTYTPSQMEWKFVKITVDDHSLQPNTIYRGSIILTNYCRVHSMCAFEQSQPVANSADTGVTDLLPYGTGNAIKAADLQDLAETGTKLWQHNGSQLFSWSRKSAASTITTSSNLWKNVISNTNTAFSSTSAGVNLNLQFLGTSNAGSMPYELGVYATRTAGSGTLEVRFEQSGKTLLSATGITAASSPMYTTTGNLGAASLLGPTKTDIQVRTQAGTTWRVDAIGLWQYEA